MTQLIEREQTEISIKIGFDQIESHAELCDLFNNLHLRPCSVVGKALRRYDWKHLKV